ncbi:MAG: DLW-39 family protein [Candidatus Nanopelagicales bacterium]
MKKLLLLAVAAIGGFAIFRKVTNDRAEQDLWNEAVSDSEAPVVDLR